MRLHPNTGAERVRGTFPRHGWGLAVLAAWALLGPVAALRAQRPEPFSRVEVSVAGSVNVSRERLHEYWKVGEGGLLRVATPFYLGSIALSVQRTPFTPREPDLPTFDATTSVMDWSMERSLVGRIRGAAGVQLGNIRFDFVEPQTGRTRDESELLAGARAGLDIRLAGGLGLAAAASHQRILTRLPIDLTFVTVGLSYSLDAPRWFREFLQ